MLCCLTVGSLSSQPVETTNPSGSSANGGKNNGLQKQDKDKKHDETSVCVPDVQGASASQRTYPDGKRTEKSQSSNKSDIKLEESGDVDKMRQSSETVDQENGTVADGDDSAKPESPHNKNDQLSETIKLKQAEECCSTKENGDGHGVDTDSICDLDDEESFGDNGCSDKKETETESQNSEQSGVTMGEESLDHSMVDEEEEDEEDTDKDDHLIYLQEILMRIHNEYYSRYEAYLRGDCSEMPDIRKIVPELKSSSLAGTNIVFSGLYPTNYPMERTRESYHAKALGAKIGKRLVLNPKDPNCTTHLIAARAGKLNTFYTTGKLIRLDMQHSKGADTYYSSTGTGHAVYHAICLCSPCVRVHCTEILLTLTTGCASVHWHGNTRHAVHLRLLQEPFSLMT